METSRRTTTGRGDGGLAYYSDVQRLQTCAGSSRVFPSPRDDGIEIEKSNISRNTIIFGPTVIGYSSCRRRPDFAADGQMMMMRRRRTTRGASPTRRTCVVQTITMRLNDSVAHSVVFPFGGNRYARRDRRIFTPRTFD